MNNTASIKKKFDFKQWFDRWNTFLVFVIIVVVSAILSPNFLTVLNITNLMKQNAGIGIIAMGMLFVILTGGIDLSVGAIVGVGNVIFAYVCVNQGIPMAILATLVVGLFCGAVSGYFVSYRNLQPFVVTLAVMTIARGYAYIICKGASINLKNFQAVLDFGNSRFLGVPSISIVMFLVSILAIIILRHSAYGRVVVSIGSNEEAVRLSGINVKQYKFSVYCLSGLCSAIAAILNSARTGTGSPLTGDGFELDAIAILVLGGVSLKGGKGSAVKVLIGIFILGMIGNIMNLIKVSAYTQQVVKGFIILIAVFVQTLDTKKT